MDLSGRKALVTGGAGHIGLAVCEVLGELGAAIGMLDLDAEAARARAAALRRRWKWRVTPLPCDLTDEEATRRAIDRAIETMDGLDILVHCAAYVGTTQIPGWSVPFDQQTVEAWDAAMRVNLTSAFVMAQEARKALSASGHGAVIFLSSIYGMVGPDLRVYAKTTMAHAAAYDASKGGLLQLTRYLATVLAPRVRVNAISPGGVWRKQPEAFHRSYISRTPLRRMATEEDLKGAVAYLASDLSSYVTGQNLVVDGGWTVW
jgi:NAD(P)-dependent dehydrogenase (short-subunit alcohol dehydrogenase family)